MIEMEDNKYVQKLRERFLECPVCLEEFNEDVRVPRVLPCLHTHCDSCLKNILKDNRVQCSLCQKDYSVPEGNLTTFPTDYTRNDLRDFVSASLHRPDLVCEGCSSGDTARYRCKTCAHFLCQNCGDAHNRLVVLKEHELFSLDEENSSEENLSMFTHQEICETPGHDREPMHFYCQSQGCDKSICTRCFLLHHKDHDVKDIHDVYNSRKTKLEEEAALLYRRIEECDNMKSKVAKAKMEIGDNVARSLQELNASFEIAEKILRKRKEDLIGEIKRVAERKNAVLEKQDASVETFAKSIENCCDFLHQSLTYNNQPAFLKIAPIIAERFSALLSHPLDKEPFETSFLSFNHGNNVLAYSTFVQSMGRVESSKAYGPHTQIRSEAGGETNELKVTVKLRTHDGKDTEEPLEMKALLIGNSQVISINEMGMREDGTYELVVKQKDSTHLRLKAFDERLTVWEGPIPIPKPTPVHGDRNGTSPSCRRRRRSSEIPRTERRGSDEDATPNIHIPVSDIGDDNSFLSSPLPERPPLPKQELLQPNLSLQPDHHVQTNGSRTGTARPDRSITKPAIHFDEKTLHKSLFLSKDRKNLFNRRHTNLQSKSEKEEKRQHLFSTTRGRREHKLQRYQGVKASRQIKFPDDFYIEVDINFHFDHELAHEVAIFEIGFAHDNAIDSSDLPGNDKHACSIAAHAKSNTGAVQLVFKNNGRLVNSQTIQSCLSEEFKFLTFGINIDTHSHTITVLDRSRSAQVLCKFTEQDFRSGVWPIFGVFNPQKVDVILTLKTETDIMFIPFHALK